MHRLLVLLLFLALSPSQAQTPPAESLCGPEVVTTGDAWESAKVELHELQRILHGGDLVRWPQRYAALISHMRFMENRAILPPAAREKIATGVRLLVERQMLTASYALGGNAVALRAEWPQVQSGVALVGKQFPADMLVPLTSLAHLLPPIEPSLRMTTQAEPLVAGKEATVKIQLPTASQVRVLVIDAALSDFQHPAAEPAAAGEYVIRFTPRAAGAYRLCALATPQSSNREEALVATLASNDAPASVESATALTATSGDLRARLDLDSKPRAGEIVSAKLIVETTAGAPVADLERYEASFAFVAAFSADGSPIQTRTPAVLPIPDLRGGPSIPFRFRPPSAGFVRLVAEVRRDGVKQTFSFGFTVEPAAKR